MKKAAVASVDEYIASQPELARAALVTVRRAIRKAIPAAEEVISYRIPTYKLHGHPVIYFAGWRQHYSVYPAGASLVAAFRRELAGYEVEKGTIRFQYSQLVPVRLIAAIAKFRAKEAAETVKAEPALRRPRPPVRR
jgi:uncharacterized protein YdhG (YjbR/CyaY superfamily)